MLVAIIGTWGSGFTLVGPYHNKEEADHHMTVTHKHVNMINYTLTALIEPHEFDEIVKSEQAQGV